MSRVSFYIGDSSSIENHNYTEGALYLHPLSDAAGELYCDLGGYRRKVSQIYNDTALTQRISTLESTVQNLTDGDNLGYGA